MVSRGRGRARGRWSPWWSGTPLVRTGAPLVIRVAAGVRYPQPLDGQVGIPPLGTGRGTGYLKPRGGLA